MGRGARDNRPYVKPVEKIELSKENIPLRAVAAVVFLLIGVGALTYAVSQFFSTEPGWQTIEAGTSEGPTCGDEFVLLYEAGASGRSAREEGRDLSQLYTRACRTAFQLFHTELTFEGVVSLKEINDRPNEALEVDPALYQAFEAVRAAGDRSVYLGPVYARYNDLFYCGDDSQLTDFDPRLSPEVAEEYAAVAAFAGDPASIDVELLGDNRIRLRVSEEYLAYARENGVQRFLDFGWMKNAFVADYLADTLAEGGFTNGAVSSVDGFARCLDGREGRYGLNLLGQLEEGRAVQAGTVEYQGPMSLVSLRSFPAVAGDETRYYRLKNGQVRTLYLDPADGLCRGAADFLAVYSAGRSCAQLAMEAAPVFIAETLDRAALERLASEGVSAVSCQDRTIWAGDPSLTVSGLYQGFTLTRG